MIHKIVVIFDIGNKDRATEFVSAISKFGDIFHIEDNAFVLRTSIESEKPTEKIFEVLKPFIAESKKIGRYGDYREFYLIGELVSQDEEHDSLRGLHLVNFWNWLREKENERDKPKLP